MEKVIVLVIIMLYILFVLWASTLEGFNAEEAFSSFLYIEFLTHVFGN